jgi:hypothetical protein
MANVMISGGQWIKTEPFSIFSCNGDVIRKLRRRGSRKVLKGLRDVPQAIMTDKLAIDGAARQEIAPGVEYRQHHLLNNHADHFYPPTRQPEWPMRLCKPAGHA